MIFIFLLSPPLKEIFQMIIQGEQFVAKKLGMVVDVYPARSCLAPISRLGSAEADVVFTKGFLAWGEWEGTELTCEIILIAH